MIMSRFRSMGLVAGAAASVLSCYMVSLRVARERGEVERVQQQIVDARNDIRDLRTELSTRGRMRQLELWNSNVLALSAPVAAQYLKGAVQLASYQPSLSNPAPAANAPAQAVPAVQVKSAGPGQQAHVMTASYKPSRASSTSRPAGPNAGLIHTASYVTTHDKVSTRVAMLDDNELGPVGRGATHEVKPGRKAAP
jgi:hypothetical protein